MSSIKYSRQREAIKNFLATRKDHPTADTVYSNIQRQYPRISLGTVYRNLALLTQLGEINKICTGDGPDRFDYFVAPHSHFVCRKCHCVTDLDIGYMDFVLAKAQENCGGQIEKYTATFYGICDKCSKNDCGQ